MEENKQTTHQPSNADTPQEGNGGTQARHRRRHRGGKKHNHHNKRQTAPSDGVINEGAAKNENVAETLSQIKPAQKQNREEQKNNNQIKSSGKENDKKKKGNRRERQSFDRFSHTDDIYGNSQEERELAEWRAKIVLNAAPSPTDSPVQEPTPTPLPAASQKEEEDPSTLSSDELLESPVMQPITQVAAERVEVVGIRFRAVGKMYYFAPQGNHLQKGDFAIVETARGPEFGEVCLENSMVNVNETVTPLRPVLRIASKEDIAHNKENTKKEKEALEICQKKIEEHKLDMKLIEAQYAFDNSKLLFYFSSEGRVDFRELVKDLASIFRTRIELRQIGVRDEAKMLGGFGPCGRTLCCSTFLPDFAQVSIKMAKEQGLSLNSAKISGTCGRLMCCLRFESDVYAEETRLTPSADSVVKTEDGIGTVISANPLAGTVRVILKDSPDTPPKQYHRDTITVIGKNKRSDNAQPTQNEKE